jgi:radical SAM protein with 4Fe4S-binding SPASM domain
MLRDLVRRTTLLQRVVVHRRALRLARTHPEGLVPPVPRRIVVEPTNACNLGCAYCGNKDMVRPRTFLDLEVYRRLLDEMVELGIPRLTLHTIGEPTLHPQIARMLEMASKRQRCVTISTNGSLLVEDLARRMVAAGPDILNISADAADESLAITRDGLDYRDLVEKLRVLRRIRDEEGPVRDSPWGPVRLPTLTITCVVTPHFDRATERRFFEAYAPLVDDFLFHFPNNHGDYVHDEPHRRRHLLPKRWVDAIFRSVREPCHYPWDALFLLSDGTMSVCRFDFDARIRVGRYPESSIPELWNSQEMRSLRRAHLAFRYEGWEQCRDCTATFYENRHQHHAMTQKLKRRNGVITTRPAWLNPDPRGTSRA